MAFGGKNVARQLAFVNTFDTGNLSRAVPLGLVLGQFEYSDIQRLSKDLAQKRRSTLSCNSKIGIIRDKFDEIFMYHFRFVSGSRSLKT